MESDIKIRRADPDEWDAFSRVAELVFGQTMTDERRARAGGAFEFDRGMTAEDHGELVATGGAYSLDLTLPGLTTIPVGGLTWISVLPTHRRRGILRRMIGRHFDDVLERGEPASILIASESVIYGRFGYGPATQVASYEIDTHQAAFAQPVGGTGRVRAVRGDEALQLLPAVFDRARRRQPGEITRSQEWWSTVLSDPEWMRHGDTAAVNLVYERAPGQAADGYARYRLHAHWERMLAAYTVKVEELMALTPQAHATLWRFLLDLDLSAKLELFNGRVDEPLRWRLADPRQLRTTFVGDAVWVRLLDIPAALAARRYGVADRLVLEVTDALRPERGGRFALEGGPDGAACAPTSEDPDIVLGVAELGATYLGGARFSALAAATRATEATTGALARADHMFLGEQAPFCSRDF
ncbi:MAG TPA: GNAT family N-acetyltransferase [Actinomycetes bacterium]|jgi:predicted acetyltransferase|nr:GNAT family N-acetyltransferase [Actinomycetes bacterium]